MPWFVKLILSFEGLIAVGSIIAIIFLAFRRVRLKREETFEKRDN